MGPWNALQHFVILPPCNLVEVFLSPPEGSSRPTEVYWFENILSALENTQWKNRVRVVSMRNMTLPQQASLAMDSAIFLANQGGGSITSLFLN